MRKMNGRVFVYSCGLFLLLFASVGGHSRNSASLSGSAYPETFGQNREAVPLSPLLSSEGKTPSITLQGTRAYPFKSLLEAKTVVWKSDRLFTGTSRPASAVIADAVIYVSLSLSDAYFYALDAGSGKRTAFLRLPNTRISPLAVAGNMVFMGTSDGSFRALDSQTGEIKWQVNRNDYHFNATTPIVADGVLFFTGTQRNINDHVTPDGTLHAFDALKGQPFWMLKTKGTATSLAIADGTIYFGDKAKNLFAVDIKTGNEKWRFKAEDNIYGPAISAEQIYFSDIERRLYSVNRTSGRLNWKVKRIENRSIGLFNQQIGNPTVAAVASGLLFYADTDNSIRAVDANSGKEKWRFKAGDTCTAPVIAGDVVYFASADNFLYAVDCATGKERWKYKSQNPLRYPPLLTEDTIYLLDSEGFLYALR
jgi:eukaryotic-like serine/threonine-protein kinase